MISREDDSRLRATLDPPAPAPGFAERVLRAVRERRRAGAAALAFDVAASDRGIAGLRPGSGRVEAATRRARALAKRVRAELAEYLEGLRSYFTVPLDLSTTASFQRSVLDVAATIPFGEVRSYRWIAEAIGKPGAVRAVGTALGRNPVPIVVPCHRVLRSDGGLGGYAFGLDLKERLLALEHETPALVGSDATRIICRHGCGDEQRIAVHHRVVFASLSEARASGYRACRRCLEGRSSPSSPFFRNLAKAL
ncbi:MAG: methylated-DNA--[protein]-cysteine S-methyltransferase [Deltaproteobacteria bacterium]|nr:methylated-DNA--[protein]-cysteine S-methyltransferase [Deltaproteobacteria bacterium]